MTGVLPKVFPCLSPSSHWERLRQQGAGRGMDEKPGVIYWNWVNVKNSESADVC